MAARPSPIFASGPTLSAADDFGAGATDGVSEACATDGDVVGAIAGGNIGEPPGEGASRDGTAVGAPESLVGGAAEVGGAAAEVGGAAVAAEMELIVTFMPPLQCPGVPQMKYLFPGVESLMIEFPSMKLAIALFVEHVS